MSLNSDTNEFSYHIQQLELYQTDKIKFVTKIQVDDGRMENMNSYARLVKQPIYSQNDLVVFLILFQWYPNSVRNVPKIRKGSFAIQKQNSTLKVKFSKNRVQDEDLLCMVYLLSEKLYIDQKYIDQFSRVISNRHEISSKHQNCLTAVVLDSSHKRNMTNMASTVDETKYHFYYNQNIPSFDLDKVEKNLTQSKHQQMMMNRMTFINKPSSHNLQKQIRKSMGSKQLLDDSGRKQVVKFNLEKVKKYFSSLQYIVTDGQINIDMIIYHLSDSEHTTQLGFRYEAIEQFFNSWPKYKQYNPLFSLNKNKYLTQLIAQTVNNYSIMLSMEISEVNNIKLEQIYANINQFNAKTVNQFIENTQQYLHQSDYQKYLLDLENKLRQQEQQLLTNYALTKKQFGSRMFKNIEKCRSKQNIQCYTLMKVLGKQKINHLDVGYKIYKNFVEQILQQSFKQFLNKKYSLRSHFSRNQFQNYEQEQLNQIQNRIQICEEKKKMLDSAIELQMKQTDSLKLMLRLLEKQDLVNDRKYQYSQSSKN